MFVVAVATCFQKIFIDFGVGRGARGGNACARHEKTALRIPACDGMRWRTVCYAVRPSHERDSHGQSFGVRRRDEFRVQERGEGGVCVQGRERHAQTLAPLSEGGRAAEAAGGVSEVGRGRKTKGICGGRTAASFTDAFRLYEMMSYLRHSFSLALLDSSL